MLQETSFHLGPAWNREARVQERNFTRLCVLNNTEEVWGGTPSHAKGL